MVQYSKAQLEQRLERLESDVQPSVLQEGKRCLEVVSLGWQVAVFREHQKLQQSASRIQH